MHQKLKPFTGAIFSPLTREDILGYIFRHDDPTYPANEKKRLDFLSRLLYFDKDLHTLLFKPELIYSYLDALISGEFKSFVKILLKKMPCNQTNGYSTLITNSYKICHNIFMPKKLSDRCCSAIWIDKINLSDLWPRKHDLLFLCFGLTARGRFRLLLGSRSANPEDYLLWKSTIEKLADRGLTTPPKVIGDLIGDVKAGLKAAHKGYDSYGVMPANVQKLLNGLRRELTELMARKEGSRLVALPKSKSLDCGANQAVDNGHSPNR
jgi:hypothetical protein